MLQVRHFPRVRSMRILEAGIAICTLLTALIWLGAPLIPHVEFLPQKDAFDYPWRLAQPTFWTHFTGWTAYTLHQVAIWGCVWWAKRQHTAYSTRLHPINWIALGINLLFSGLHFIQTYLWYDGLAQDTHILTSQGAVIVLLVLVMIMENPRRGVFFGKKLPLQRQFVDWFKQYHGYLFSFAIIYTFWYHPMEATSGHLAGFFYMFLLLLQSSLFFTTAHVNRLWTFTLEFLVLIHGTLVAVMQGKGMWPMFLFGFAGVLIVTQMHGLGLSRRARWLLFAGFVAAILITYTLLDRWGHIDEIIRIPAIDYVLIVLIYGCYLGGLLLYRLTRNLGQRAGNVGAG